MKKQTLLVVDPDCSFRKQLINDLKQSDFPAVFWEASNGIEAVKYINALQPDVVFLNVYLKGFDGFEVLDKIEHTPFVVLISDSTSCAARAFEYDAIDYLLKPIRIQRLQASLQKLTDQSRLISDSLRDMPTLYPQYILVESGNRLVKIDISEVTHLKADRDYTEMYTLQGKTYLSNYGIGEIIQRIDPQQFIRIHRSYVVNLDYINECYKDINKFFIILPNDVELNVSRNYLPYIKQLIF